MNLYDSVLASLPRTAFKLNSGGTSFTDLTNRAVTLTGTQLFSNSIVSGNAKSLLAKNTNILNFATTIFTRGIETQPFALECWVLPTAFTGTISIMSHTGAYDGLYFDGDKIHFKVEFETLGSLDISFAVADFPDAMHIVANYGVNSIQLYVNGERAASADLTDAQIADGFKTRANTNLFIGESATATQAIVIDGIAVYARTLSDSEIYKHFTMGRRVIAAQDVSGAFGGYGWYGNRRDIFSYKEWSGKDWYNAIYTNVEFEAEGLKPAEDPATQLSKAGTWTGVYEAGASPTNLYGVKVDWDADGSYVVQASLDGGTTWTASLVNNRIITGTYNWVVTDKIVLIRVTFTGGITADPAVIRRLRVTGYSTNKVYGNDNSRYITLSDGLSSTANDANEPIENNYGAGIEIYGGVANIQADATADIRNTAAIEFWFKWNGPPASGYVFDARPGGDNSYLWVNGTNQLSFAGQTAVYVNGAAVTSGSFVPITGVWYHIVFVFDAPHNFYITLPATGAKNYDIINIYPTAPTAAQVLTMYKAYGGYPEATLVAEDINVQEAATPFNTYAYDWTLTGS